MHGQLLLQNRFCVRDVVELFFNLAIFFRPIKKSGNESPVRPCEHTQIKITKFIFHYKM